MAVQPGLCRIWSETRNTGFLTTRLISGPDVRLVGGRGNYEGRIDWNYDGEWSSVCDVQFDDKDASVVCKSLGFTAGYIYY